MNTTINLKAELPIKYTPIKTSRRGITGLKYTLPIILILIIAGILHWQAIETYFWNNILVEEGPNSSQEFVIPDGKIATNQARNIQFDGVDRRQQPYTLIAKEGIEYADNHSDLVEPHLTINLKSGEKVYLSANKSHYDRKSQLIELIDNVVLVHSTGYKFTTQQAWVNLENSTAHGELPVTGAGPHGDIYAPAGFVLTDRGHKIKFLGRPELTLQKVEKNYDGEDSPPQW